MKTKLALYVKVLKFGVILLTVSFLLSPIGAIAQEDTTPPVLLDFRIDPILFDTSETDVTISFCVTVADDISGASDISVRADDPNSSPLDGIFGIVLNSFEGATSPTEKCSSAIAPIGAPQLEYLIQISLKDRAGNRRVVKHPLHPCAGSLGCENAEDLCDAGFVCSIENTELTPLPDNDADGVPDIADNCPADFNADQADADLDLIGDVCDPFPDDQDNEQAQCEADLEDCTENPIFIDEDEDGEPDSTDLCPGTLLGEDIDSDGCAIMQFCMAINTSSHYGRRVCRRSDWKNDEPLKNIGDCKAVKQGKDPSNYSCVPR
jgi:hypothetical protein